MSDTLRQFNRIIIAVLSAHQVGNKLLIMLPSKHAAELRVYLPVRN